MADDELIQARLRLQDARKFIADASAAAAAVKGVGAAAETTGRQVEASNRRSFAYTQGLYTLRRGAFYATTGLLGLGSAAVVMGFKFNASMESNQLVMGQFLGSAQAARKELGALFNLAATGPFEFTNLVSAARQFLAFGFTLKETNQDLRILSDTAAGLQLGGAGIEHLVMVFGQIRASGRLLGQDMLQLQQAGINVRGILQSQLGLSKQQMLDLAKGTLSIPSSVAIPAIMAGLNRAPSQGGFRGLSQRLQGTFSALVATAHDYASQLFGTITHPFFLDAERGLKRLNPLLLQAGRAFKTGGFDAMFQTLDRGVGANGRLVEGWREIRAVGQDVSRIVRGALIPAFGLLWATLGLGSPPMKLLIGLLGFAADHTTLLKIAIGLLAARFIYTRAATVLLTIAMRLNRNVMLANTAAVEGATAAQKLQFLWTNRTTLAMGAARSAAIGLRGSLLALKALGVIAVAVVVDQILRAVLPQAPERTGNSVRAKTDRGIRKVPVIGPVFGFGEYLGNKTTDLIESHPTLDRILSLGDSHNRKQVARRADTEALGAAIGRSLAKNLNIRGDVTLNGKKVGNSVFAAQQSEAARATG